MIGRDARIYWVVLMESRIRPDALLVSKGYCLDIVVVSMMWCLSESVLNVEREGGDEGINEGENFS